MTEPVAAHVGVTALICTRDRPAALTRMVRSLLDGSGDFELIVVDQSEGRESERTLLASALDRRLRYVRMGPRGAGAALQEGLRLARPILVCADDDCEAAPGWVANMARTLAEHPSAVIVFCNVVAAPHDGTRGYVPTYERRRSRLVRSIAGTLRGHGLSAGMALRRDVIQALGGFDEALGPGGRFPAGDDWDFAFRALLGGFHVYETADVSIVHHGYRTLAEGRVHARRDFQGIGAVCSKLVRTRRFSATLLPLWEFSTRAVWPPVADLLCLSRPRGLARIVGFVEGFTQGLRTPMDRTTMLFTSRTAVAGSQTSSVEPV